jgi:uncharacterized membrane protein YtjA (UPF0391 family)
VPETHAELVRQLPRAAAVHPQRQTEEVNMLQWIIIFLVVALVAGGLGFGGVASAASGAAGLLFWIFLILVLAGLVTALIRRA